MKNIIISLIVFCSLFTVINVPLHLNAQEQITEQTEIIELNDNEPVSVKSDEVSILSIVGLIVIAISIPFITSLLIQLQTHNTLAAYICTYCIVVLLFYLFSYIKPQMTGTENIMTYIFLLIPSMLGSLMAQFAYYIMLVRFDKKKV